MPSFDGSLKILSCSNKLSESFTPNDYRVVVRGVNALRNGDDENFEGFHRPTCTIACFKSTKSASVSTYFGDRYSR